MSNGNQLGHSPPTGTGTGTGTGTATVNDIVNSSSGGASSREAGRGVVSAASVRSDLRFFANELRVTFFRRRNQLLLLVTALFPLLIGIGLKLSAPHGRGGGGGPSSSGAAYFSQLAGNGVFLTFVALSL